MVYVLEMDWDGRLKYLRSWGGHKETMNPLQTVENIENQMHSQDKEQQFILSIHLDSFSLEKRKRDVDTYKTSYKLITKKKQYINSISQESHKNSYKT